MSSRTLDLRGQICPYTLLMTKEVLKEINDSDTLEVLTSHYPSAGETIPSFCRNTGYEFSIVEEEAFWRIVIKKPTEK